MRIGIIGGGNVGSALADGWRAAGHEVRVSTRADVHEVAQGAEVVLFAVPAMALEDAAATAGPLGERVVIDATNPVGPGFTHGLPTGSNAERLREWTGSARVVKAFNTIGFNVMAAPRFGDTAATLLYAGDDATAKATVHALASALGFAPQDAGPLARARLLEHAALLWISLAMQPGGLGREIAFALHRR